jgi:hypothetical protein
LVELLSLVQNPVPADELNVTVLFQYKQWMTDEDWCRPRIYAKFPRAFLKGQTAPPPVAPEVCQAWPFLRMQGA